MRGSTFLILVVIFFSSCEKYELNSDSNFTDACGSANNTICLRACPVGTEDCLPALRADGLTTITLTAYVPAEIKAEFNEISFKTSKGNFPGEVDKINPKIKSQDGQASVVLNVGTVSGPGKVEASIIADNITYNATYEFELIKVEETSLAFLIDESDPSDFQPEAIADGERVVKLTTLVDGLDVFNKKVKLSISGAWAFADHSSSTVELTLIDVPQVECLVRMSQTAGECILRAEFEGRSKLLQINAAAAAPTTLQLIATPQLITSANGMTTLKAYLARNQAKVSTDTRVNFEASQAQANGVVNLGFFDPPFGKSNNSEIAEVKYFTPPDSIVVDSLPILITAWLPDAPAIRDSLILIVQ